MLNADHDCSRFYHSVDRTEVVFLAQNKLHNGMSYMSCNVGVRLQHAVLNQSLLFCASYVCQLATI